ncbi:DUF6964 domain-containing protein, partial [Gemmatimonadota bacterium]
GILREGVEELLGSMVTVAEELERRASGVGLLPDDFPGVRLLRQANVVSLAELRSVEDLTAINGIGPKTEARIRAALGVR